MTQPVKSASNRSRNGLWWVGGSVLVVLLGLLVWRGPNAIRRWQSQRFLENGREMMAQGRFQEAAMMFNKASLKAPTDAECVRAMADLLRKTDSPQEVHWRARIVELGQTNLDSCLDWAESALRASQVDTANRALGMVAEAERTGARYHRLAGILAVTLQRSDAAETHFLEAIRLEPANLAPQLNLAALRLVSTNAAKSETGRKTLLDLAEQPGSRHEALRHLATDAMRHERHDQAVRFTQRLTGGTNVVFADRLLHLSALQAARSPELEASTQETRAAAGTNVTLVAELGTWLCVRDRAAEALKWLETQPAALQREQVIRVLTVECLYRLKDWKRLAGYLDAEPWGEADYHRLCLLARLRREGGDTSTAEALWRRSLLAASREPQHLAQLARFTSSWRWLPELEQVLVTIAERWPRERWALQQLSEMYYASGRTRQLQGALKRMLEQDPGNTMLKNNLAMASLLLDPASPEGRRLAQEVYGQDSTNATYVSTYAFSLLRQNQAGSAVELLSRLPASQLEEPGVAAYYGMALAMAGRHDAAAPYLALAAKGRLLPEESNLVAQARSRP